MQNNKDILHELDTWHHHYTKIQQTVHEKIQELRTTIKNQNDTIHTLQQQIRDYEQQENYKTKYTQTQEHLDKEKERLEKLYHKYWETENECQLLREEITQWHSWFDQNRKTFEKVFTDAPQRLNKPDQPSQDKHPETPNEDEKPPKHIKKTPTKTKPQRKETSKQRRTKTSSRRRLRLRH